MLAGTMGDTPFPLPRSLRESTILVGDGTAGPYGPSQYKIFDTADVTVWALPQGETVFQDVTDSCTIQKTSSDELATFTVTFDAPVPATTQWYHQARRVSERSVAVTRAGTIDAPQLEQELSKQASALIEMRRDINRAMRFPAGIEGDVQLPILADAQTIVWDDEAKRFVPGPSAGDIEGAAQAAEEAKAARDEAVEAKNAAQDASAAAQLAAEAAQAIAEDVIENHGIDWSGGNASNTEKLTLPQLIRSVVMPLETLVDKDDTSDAWWMDLKRLLETDNSYRRDLLGGSVLTFGSNRSWLLKSRPGYITLPQYLHMEMGPGAFIDATDLPFGPAPRLLSYEGHYGDPTRPTVGDYPAGTTQIGFDSEVVASRGWRIGDRLIIRATEGLGDMSVGAWSLTDGLDANQPVSFSFWRPDTSYEVGDGVIANSLTATADKDWNGYCLRCISAHTSGSTFDRSKWVPTGLNAIAEDVRIEGIDGDTIRLSAALRYSYPQASRPVLCKYEAQGRHTFTNFNWVGNSPNGPYRGNWVTGQSYTVGDTVYGDRPSYICLVDHTSGVFADDLAAGKWAFLGSDRVLALARTDKVTIEGGLIERLSGIPIYSISVGDLVLRDFTYRSDSTRNRPGGGLFIGGGYNKGLLDNVLIEGAGQPFMLSSSGGHYGVGYGLVHRHCTARGGSGGFTQHDMFDGTVYDNCEHDCSISTASAAASFDIRSPSTISNCRSNNNTLGVGVLFRTGFMGRGVGDRTDRGTLVTGFHADNVRVGIAHDNASYGGVSYPATSGRVDITDSVFTNVGGVSPSAIALAYTQTIGGVRPTLGRVRIVGNYASMRDAGHCFRLAGKWTAPEVSNNYADFAPGVEPTGFRAYMFESSGGGAGNGPSTIVGSGNKQAKGFGNVFIADTTGPHAWEGHTVVNETVVPTQTIGGGLTRAIGYTPHPMYILAAAAGTTDNLDNIPAMAPGTIRSFKANSGHTITVRNGQSNIYTKSGSNLSLTANVILTLRCDGTNWYEV